MFNVLKITGKFDTLPEMYCTYSLSKGVILYVGVCRLNELLYLPDAKSNTLYSMCFPINEDATIELLYVDIERNNCLSHASNIIQMHQPVMNVHGFVHNRFTSPITCNETGEVFQTMDEVVLKHGVTLNALCRHLHNLPGYKTVRGNTYSRGKHGELTAAPQFRQRARIKNNTTGHIYENAAQAARILEVSPVSISRHLSGYLKTIKGNKLTKL